MINAKSKRLIELALLTFLILLYLLYVGFVISKDQGPIDYETFMQIGARFLGGEEVYIENSYYPLPYVMVFAFFSWLPRPLSMALWLLLPVVAGLWISGWKPWVLLFGPLFAHFVGGQSALFALLGFQGFKKNLSEDHWRGGAWLALTLLKPQLGLVPVLFATYLWWKSWKSNRRIPRQLLGWAVATALLYIPSFIIRPDWPIIWLSNPRPFFERAMAGFAPRTLLFFMEPGLFYGLILVSLAVGLFLLAWRHRAANSRLDLLMLSYFIVSPLVHDYDLIQLIPTIQDRQIHWTAVLLSIPSWAVILLAYEVDSAWYAVTIIAPGLLLAYLFRRPQTYLKSSAGSLPTHHPAE
ncbi:MAG: DUF2029 domain-containing protein [Anaerolineaceae bacterium]|nr:DUF2029 domain-containing protein [Anaerolineaceae bacterium]